MQTNVIYGGWKSYNLMQCLGLNIIQTHVDTNNENLKKIKKGLLIPKCYL